MTNNPWIVGSKGGDDVLKQFIVSRLIDSKRCAREWIMDGDFVKVFDERAEAEKVAKKIQ